MRNIFVVNNETSKILKFEIQKEITVYRNYSFPLCIILSNEFLKDWMMNHFGNVYLMRNGSEYVWFDFLEPSKFTNDVLDVDYITINELRNVDMVSKIKSLIDEGEYVTVFIDEYYLDGTQYVDKHEITEVLIYGYDNKDKIFYTVNYNDENIFATTQYSYSDIETSTAYISNNVDMQSSLPIWVSSFTITTYKIKYFEKYVYSPVSIFNEITDYCSSKELYDYLRPEIIIERGKRAVFGFNTQKIILDCMYKFLEDDFKIDFRYIHLLCEQKKSLHNKLIRLNSDYSLGIDNDIEEYQKICDALEIIRITYICGLLSDKTNEKSIYGKLKDEKKIKKMIGYLEFVVQNEKVILENIVEKLKIALSI